MFFHDSVTKVELMFLHAVNKLVVNSSLSFISLGPHYKEAYNLECVHSVAAVLRYTEVLYRKPRGGGITRDSNMCRKSRMVIIAA